MLHAIGYVALAYSLMIVTWLFYLAVMSLAPHRDKLHPVAKAHAYVLLAIGLALDLVLNVVVASVLFAKYPEDWLLTGRLTRYCQDTTERPWRRALSGWLCRNLLDPFDTKGGHCR